MERKQRILRWLGAGHGGRVKDAPVVKLSAYRAAKRRQQQRRNPEPPRAA